MFIEIRYMNWFKKASFLTFTKKCNNNIAISHLSNLNGWFSKILRVSSYNYTQALDAQIRDIIPIFQSISKKYDGAGPVISKLDTALKSLAHAAKFNDPAKTSQAQSKALSAIRNADKFLQVNDIYNSLPPAFKQNIQQTSQLSPTWNNYLAGDADVKEKVQLVDGARFNQEQPGPENWIQLSGLKLYHSDISGNAFPNPVFQYAQEAMGNWLIAENNGQEANVYVRGTKEAWNAFKQQIAPWVLTEPQKLNKLKLSLPSESDINPQYQPQEEEKLQNKPLIVEAVNLEDDSSSVKTYEPSGKGMVGIRLRFQVDHPSYRKDFPHIVEMIYSEGQVEPNKTRVDANNGIIDIFDIPKKNKQERAGYLHRIAKSLRSKFGYENTTDISKLVEQLTGVALRESEDVLREKHTPVASAKVMNGRLKKNIYNKPQISSRFSGLMQQLGIDSEQDINLEQFQSIVASAYKGSDSFDPNKPYGPDNWQGPFGPQTTPNWRSAQSEGMSFVASRHSSIIADQPGSGKTVQSIIGADIAREEGKKVLVYSPNMLIAENWTGSQAKGPTFCCGHDRSQIAEVGDVDSLNRAMQDPNIIWVIVGFSKLGQSNQNTENFRKALNDYGKSGAFSASIMDEIQTIKDVKSITAKKIIKSIPKDIPFQIGLTGTPSDNKPFDIFSQLRFVNHPILFRDKGKAKSQGLEFSTSKFANEYLGGQSLATDVNLTPDEKKLPEETRENLLTEKWAKKAHDVLDWVYQLDDDRKKIILDLFSTTYLRRNKEDIRPELAEEAPLTRNENLLDIPPNLDVEQEGENWHNKALLKMAKAKIPATVQKAVQYIEQDPEQHIFVVTKHPEVADEISNNINAKLGDISVAVHGGTKKEYRGDIADAFRNPNSPIKIVVYSMKLGAIGLNFDNATQAIFNDMDWNPSNNLQAEFRVHRITSKKPVNVDYMVFKNTYDQEMYDRVMKKKNINDTMSDLIRDSRQVKNPKEKINLANSFVKNLINNILLDVGLSPKLQDWFEKNMNKSLQGEAPQSHQDFQQLKQEEERPKDPLDQIIPDWAEEDPIAIEAWKSFQKKILEREVGEGWEKLTPNQIKQILEEAEKKKKEKKPKVIDDVPNPSQMRAKPKAKAKAKAI